jgi:hypothetical protein
MEKEAVPQQVAGAHFDVHRSLLLPQRAAAIQRYTIARKRLLNVSQWGLLTGEAPDGFILTDSAGNKAERLALEGDRIKIHLTAPFSWLGNEADWVVIEKIMEERNKLLDEIFTAMTVRPCPDPCSDKNEVAHFYEPRSSNTLMVCRHRVEMVASIHGRNEKVNTDTGWLELFRNMVVALPSKAGFSNPHWKSLAKGFIE